MAQADPSAAAAQQEARDRYIESALHLAEPPALKGLREAAEGTGFYVTADDIVTNFHVAGRCTAVTVGNGTEGNEEVAQFLAGDEVDDLALLAVRAEGVPAAFDRKPYLEAGLPLAVFGYPAHGLAVRMAELSPAVADGPSLVDEDPTYLFHGEVHPGNSGSPVLDQNAAVVGIVVKKIDTPAVYRRTGEVIDDIGMAIANHVVIAFLKANHLAVRMAIPASPLQRSELIDEGRGFVRQIGCWR
jgi:S1-C subfamily serine protease